MSSIEKSLMQKANEYHWRAEDCAMSAINNARLAGAYLNQLKSETPHGQWLQLVEREFEGSRQTAAKYMKLDKEYPNVKDTLHLGIESALQYLSAPEEVKQIVDQRIESGKKISEAEIKRLKAEAKAEAELELKTKYDEQIRKLKKEIDAIETGKQASNQIKDNLSLLYNQKSLEVEKAQLKINELEKELKESAEKVQDETALKEMESKVRKAFDEFKQIKSDTDALKKEMDAEKKKYEKLKLLAKNSAEELERAEQLKKDKFAKEALREKFHRDCEKYLTVFNNARRQIEDLFYEAMDNGYDISLFEKIHDDAVKLCNLLGQTKKPNIKVIGE